MRFTLIGFSAGLLAGCSLALFPDSYYGLAALLALAVCAGVFGMSAARPLLCGLLLGVLQTLTHWLWWQHHAWPEALDKSRQQIEFSLVDFAKPVDSGWLFNAVDHQGRRLRLGWRQPEPPRYDCRYTATAQLQRPRGLLNPGLFDYEAWLISQGVHATGYLLSEPHCQVQTPDTLLAVRLALAHWLLQQDYSPRVSATLNGLLIGNYVDLARSDWQQLRESGTIHLLSVSGLHITLVAGFASLLVFYGVRCVPRLLLYRPAAVWAAWVAIAVALLYSLLAGFSVPTQRSLVMVAAGSLQFIVRGRWQFSSVYCVSLVAVLLLNPFSLLSVGFWFSFAATLVVIVAARALANRSYQQKLMATLQLQWFIFWLMLPLLLYCYGRVYALSLPLNLLAVPWVSFVSLPLAFLAALLMPLFPQVAQWLLDGSAWSLEMYWRGLDWATVSSLNHYWQTPQIAAWQALLAAVAVLLMLTLPRRWPMKYALALGLLPVLWPSVPLLDEGEARLYFLDVGQGLAVLVLSREQTLLFDSGNRLSESFDQGRDIVVPSVYYYGRRAIDRIVISHADSDHAAGLPSVLAELPAPVLTVSPAGLAQQYALEYPRGAERCRRGQQWQADGLGWRIDSPDAAAPPVRNLSCVLSMASPHGEVLLTGDIERAQELQLLASRPHQPLALMSAPHHGSNTSSSASLLSALAPAWVVVSSGYRNRYRHPATAVLQRYQRYGVQTVNTAEYGQISVSLSREGVMLDAALCRDRALWRLARRKRAGLCDTSANHAPVNP